MTRIKEDVAAYQKAFDQVVVLQAREEKLNASLNDIGPKAEAALTKLMEGGFAAGRSGRKPGPPRRSCANCSWPGSTPTATRPAT